MRYRNVLLALVVAGTSTSSLACAYPTLVPVPIDETLSEEQLVALDAGIQAYLSAMETYLMCNREEGLRAGEDASRVYIESIVTRHNQAVREIDEVASLVADLARHNGVTRRLSINRINTEPEVKISANSRVNLGVPQLRYHRYP